MTDPVAEQRSQRSRTKDHAEQQERKLRSREGEEDGSEPRSGLGRGPSETRSTVSKSGFPGEEEIDRNPPNSWVSGSKGSKAWAAVVPL